MPSGDEVAALALDLGEQAAALALGDDLGDKAVALDLGVDHVEWSQCLV